MSADLRYDDTATEPRFLGVRVAGKVAVVTGAGAEGAGLGNGRAIAYALAFEGAKVACVDLDSERAETTAEAIRQRGGDAFAIAADVSDRAACADIISRTVTRWGRLDVLVNNVGISGNTRLDTVDEAAFQRVYDVNVKSALWMSQAALPEMIRAGGGSIVNISSIAGMQAYGSIAYGTSKAAMAQMATEIAAVHGRQGIRANTVAPGHVMTPHIAGLMPPAMREVRRKVGPLAIEGNAWDIALAVLFLASDDSRFITGVLLPVDGGVTAIGPVYAHGLITAP